jgi:methyl-accepting chemotaxis protein
MKIFENLLIQTKLLVSFGIIWIIFGGLLLIAYLTINSNLQSEKKLDSKYFYTSLTASQLRSVQLENRNELLEMVLTEDKSVQKELEQSINTRALHANQALQKLIDVITDSTQVSLMNELKETAKAYQSARKDQFDLIKTGNFNEAKSLVTGIQGIHFDKINTLLYELVEKGKKDTEKQLIKDEEKANTAKALFIVMIIISLFLCILIIIVMNNSVAKPLVKISSVASTIALGDLSTILKKDNRKDEVGILNRAFSDMVTKLSKQMNDLSEGINILASSSSEITASVTQLASSSSETATAVSETTATVEEVKQTAVISNNKAKMVSNNAIKMNEISTEGSKAIANTLEGMAKIKGQMNAIAGMVVKLSEQSQTIGEITATVNELAEQSNLLSVNAAIEAAKAGEQGKGFTVVAQEIKQLANRSKEATAQVRNILRDIQKSISSAVMATEDGTKAVDEGLKLTTISGETIQTLSDSISEASNAAIQIAASSQQQLEGMDQMVIAMENIREASLQSVASTQQSVDSVTELQKLGQKLDEMMKQYKFSK